jgi:hypothetical protein
MDYNGRELKAKTFSNPIANVGWHGQVESYEKPGRNGSETFIKQVPKENPGYAGRGSYQKPPENPFTMYLSYAKDLLIALVETKGYTKKTYDELLEAVVAGGNMLYANRPEAVDKEVEKPDTIVAVGDAEMTIEDIKGVFGEAEQVEAWPKEG